jgi:hypothetical protein
VRFKVWSIPPYEYKMENSKIWIKRLIVPMIKLISDDLKKFHGNQIFHRLSTEE